jgi:hypothetical protein
MISLDLIKEAVKDQPDGCYEDIVAHGTMSECGLYLNISTENVDKLKKKYPDIGAKKRKKEGYVDTVEENNNGEMSVSFVKKANNFVEAIGKWGASGFPTVTPEILSERLEICKDCEFWDRAGFAGTGSCRKCGCSTQAKLRMTTEKCPIGKW